MIEANNDRIKELISWDRNPMLPFEVDLLRDELKSYGLEQERLGELLGEAMDEGAETWHDNGAADAVNYEGTILSQRAEKTIRIYNTRVIVDYPKPDREDATLGSLLGLLYKGDTAVSYVALTGVSRMLPSSISDSLEIAPSDIEVITARSPLGEALLGAQAGSPTYYKVGSRTLELYVKSLQQISGDTHDTTFREPRPADLSKRNHKWDDDNL